VKIILEFRREWGNDRAYPVCPTSHVFARLTGKKTFNADHIKDIQSLGYTLEWKAPKGWEGIQ